MATVTKLSDTVTAIMAGTTITATVKPTDYPATTGTSLAYTLRTQTSRIVATATGDTSAGTWSLVVGAGDTKRLEPGDCLYTALFTDTDSTIADADSGAFRVQANPGVISRAETILNGLNASIEGRANDDQKTIQIGDVQLQFMTPGDLGTWQTHYAGIVASELDQQRVDRGLRSRNIITTRFVG